MKVAIFFADGQYITIYFGGQIMGAISTEQING